MPIMGPNAGEENPYVFNCAICLEGHESDEIIALECSHIFGTSCIRECIRTAGYGNS